MNPYRTPAAVVVEETPMTKVYEYSDKCPKCNGWIFNHQMKYCSTCNLMDVRDHLHVGCYCGFKYLINCKDYK